MGNPKNRAGGKPGTALLWAAAAATAFLGCKKDCGESVRMGDFEFSQGNYENAVKRYEKALRDDPACHNVEGKLAEARRKAQAGR